LISWPRQVKSAERIDGAMITIGIQQVHPYRPYKTG
jgi:hypothetical protein